MYKAAKAKGVLFGQMITAWVLCLSVFLAFCCHL